MSIESTVNQDLNTILRTVTGELVMSDLKQALTESTLHPDFKTNMHVIWDLTDADISKCSTAELIEAVEFIHSSSESRGDDYKIVIVAPEDLSFGISRMFEAFGNKLSISIHVLRSIDKAYQCIEEKYDTD